MIQWGTTTRYHTSEQATHDSFKRRLGKCKCSTCLADINRVDDEHSSDSSYGLAIEESVNSVNKETQIEDVEHETVTRPSSTGSSARCSSVPSIQCQDLDQTRMQLNVHLSEIGDSRLLCKDNYDNGNFVQYELVNAELRLNSEYGPTIVPSEANTDGACPTLRSLLKNNKSVSSIDQTCQPVNMYPWVIPNVADTRQTAPQTMQRTMTPVYYRLPNTYHRPPLNQPVGKSGSPYVVPVCERGGFVRMPDYSTPINHNYSWTGTQSVDRSVQPYHTGIAPVMPMHNAPSMPYLAPRQVSLQEQPLDLSVSKTRKPTSIHSLTPSTSPKINSRSKTIVAAVEESIRRERMLGLSGPSVAEARFPLGKPHNEHLQTPMSHVSVPPFTSIQVSKHCSYASQTMAVQSTRGTLDVEVPTGSVFVLENSYFTPTVSKANSMPVVQNASTPSNDAVHRGVPISCCRTSDVTVSNAVTERSNLPAFANSNISSTEGLCAVMPVFSMVTTKSSAVITTTVNKSNSFLAQPTNQDVLLTSSPSCLKFTPLVPTSTITTASSPQFFPNDGPSREQTIPSRLAMPELSIPATTELNSLPANLGNGNVGSFVPLPVMKHSDGNIQHSIVPAQQPVQSPFPAKAATNQSMPDQDDLPGLIDVSALDQQVSTVLSHFKQLPADKNCQASDVTSRESLGSVFLPPTPPAEERELHTVAVVTVEDHQQSLNSVIKLTEKQGEVTKPIVVCPTPENSAESVRSRSESTGSEVIDEKVHSVSTTDQINSSHEEVDGKMGHVEPVETVVAMPVPVCQQSLVFTGESDKESVQNDVSTARFLSPSSKDDRGASTPFTATSLPGVDCQVENWSQPRDREKLVMKLKRTKIREGKRRSSYEIQTPKQVETPSNNRQYDIKTIGYNEDAISKVVLRSLDEQYRAARDIASDSPVANTCAFGSQETLCYSDEGEDEAGDHDAVLVAVKEEPFVGESQYVTVKDDVCKLDSAGPSHFGSPKTQFDTDDESASKEMGNGEENSINLRCVQKLSDCEYACTENEMYELPLDGLCYGACVKMEPVAVNGSSADVHSPVVIPETVVSEQAKDAFSSVSFPVELKTTVSVSEVEELKREWDNGGFEEATNDYEVSKTGEEENHEMPKIVWFGSLCDKAGDCNRDMVGQVCDSYDNTDLGTPVGYYAADANPFQRTSDEQKVEKTSPDVNLYRDVSDPSSPEIRNVNNCSSDMPVLEKYEIQDLHVTVREHSQKENRSSQSELDCVQDDFVIDQPMWEKLRCDETVDDIETLSDADTLNSEIPSGNTSCTYSHESVVTASESGQNNSTSWIGVTSISDNDVLSLNGNDCEKVSSSDGGTDDCVVSNLDEAVDSKTDKVKSVHDTPSLSGDVRSRKIKDKFRILKKKYQKKISTSDPVINACPLISDLKSSNRNIWDVISVNAEVNNLEAMETTTTTAVLNEVSDSKFRPTAFVKPTFTKTSQTAPVAGDNADPKNVLDEKLPVSKKAKSKMYKGFKFMSVKLKRIALPANCSRLMFLEKDISSSPMMLPPAIAKKRGRPRKYPVVGHETNSSPSLLKCNVNQTSTEREASSVTKYKVMCRHKSAPFLLRPSGKKPRKAAPVNRTNNEHQSDARVLFQTCADHVKLHKRSIKINPMVRKVRRSRKWLKRGSISSTQQSTVHAQECRPENLISDVQNRKRVSKPIKQLKVNDQSMKQDFSSTPIEENYSINDLSSKKTEVPLSRDQSPIEFTSTKIKNGTGRLLESDTDGSAAVNKHGHCGVKNDEPRKTRKRKRKIEKDNREAEYVKLKRRKEVVVDENHTKHTTKEDKTRVSRKLSERSQKKEKKKAITENCSDCTQKEEKGRIDNDSECAPKKKKETVDTSHSGCPQKKDRNYDEKYSERSQRKKTKVVDCDIVRDEKHPERYQKNAKEQVDEIRLEQSHKQKRKVAADGNHLEQSLKKKKEPVSESHVEHRQKKKKKNLERSQKHGKLVVVENHSHGSQEKRKEEVGKTASERPRKKRKEVTREKHFESALNKRLEAVEENNLKSLQEKGIEMADQNVVECFQKKGLVNEVLANLPQTSKSKVVEEKPSERPQKDFRGVVNENLSERLREKRDEAFGEKQSAHSQKKQRKVVNENYSEFPQKSKPCKSKKTPPATEHSTKENDSNQSIICSLSPGKYYAVQPDGLPLKAVRVSNYKHSRDGPVVHKFTMKYLFKESPCTVACVRYHKQNHTTVSLLSRSLSGDPRDINHAIVDVVRKSEIRMEPLSSTDAALFGSLHGVDDKELVNLSDVFELFTNSQLNDLTHWERWKRLTGITQPFITRDKTKHFVSLRQIHEKLFSKSTIFGSLDRALRIFSFVTYVASKRELRHFVDQTQIPFSGVCKIVCVNGLADKLELIKKYLTSQMIC